MTKIFYSTFIAISKDGYIADPNGDISFLSSPKFKIKGDAGYQKYYEQVDGLVYGSSSYNKVKSFNLPTWPYQGKKQWVLTSKPKEYKNTDEITFLNCDVKALEKKISEKHVWVMGGANVINQYLKADLFNKIIICVLNIELKSGIKLFKEDALKNWNITKKEDYGDITNYTYEK